MEKKPYSPPVVTEHGDAVQQTKGFGGRYWELYATKSQPDDPPPPPNY